MSHEVTVIVESPSEIVVEVAKRGAQGLQGLDGVIGPQGIEGVVGPVGSQGLQGVAGSIGPQGLEGVVGPQGIEGTVGPQGIEGTVGSQGLPGADGPIGPQGIEGVVGPVGPQGSQGPAGTPADTSLLVVLTPATSGRNTIQPSSASVTPLVIKGVAGQTATLQEWQNSAGLVLTKIGADGALQVGTGGVYGFTTDATGSRIGIGALQNSLVMMNLGSTGLTTGFSSATSVYGVLVTTVNSGSGTVNAVQGLAVGTPIGSAPSLNGVVGGVRHASTTTTALGGTALLAASPVISTGGGITNVYGVFVNTQKITGVTNAYGVYQAGAADTNFFAGKMGIGVPTPTAMFDVRSATAADKGLVVKGVSIAGGVHTGDLLQLFKQSADTIPVFKVMADGGIDLLTAGKGLKLKSPDGLVSKTLTIDNAGALALI